MKFSLAIYSPPNSKGQAELAFDFAQSLLEQGHEIYRLFFFNDGVLNCIRDDDASTLPRAWSNLICDRQLDAVVCVASAQKRNIATVSITDGDNIARSSLLPGFCISGLAQLVDAAVQSDRLLTFAA